MHISLGGNVPSPEICQQVVGMMSMINEDELLELLNNDGEVATGAMYARAAFMDLIEIEESGMLFVNRAHEAFSQVTEGNE